jgi:hypothetical protein
MGSLTDGMARLCGEIVGLRLLRQAFVQDLQRNVAQLRASFRQAHDERSGTERAERTQAIYDLKVSVAGLRQDNLLDLKGARRAWSGLAKKSRGPKNLKPQPQAESRPGEVRDLAGGPGRQAAPPSGETSKRPPAQGGARRRSPAKGKKPGSRTQPKKKGGAGT